jgi:cytochrome d ubiquinol oxidase subunit II
MDLSLEFLQPLWYILIAVLFSVFFLLEGFDYGVGILLAFVGRGEDERKELAHSIAPFWDGNEVWMLTAGGAMFAAFPEWYATLFSGYYLALVLMLFALIVRAIGLEYRGKDKSESFRQKMDMMFTGGSLIAALLWGVVAVNIILGLPIKPDANGNVQYVGSFLDLLDWRAILGGISAVHIAALHGSLFAAVRTDGIMRARVMELSEKFWKGTTFFGVVTSGAILATVDIPGMNVFNGAMAVVAVLALVASFFFIQKDQPGKGFISTGLMIVLATGAVFWMAFPNVIKSSLDPAFSLTVAKASSSQYTLNIMTVTALIMVPIVITYQSMVYRFFMKKD